MAPLTRRREKLESATEQEIQERIAAAEAEVRAIDAKPASEIVRTGQQKETLRRYEQALDTAVLGRRELAERHRERSIDSIALGRAAEETDREKRKREKRLRPLLEAFAFVRARAHRELQGMTLVASRLSDEEGAELVQLVAKARRVAYEEEGAEPLSEEERARYEDLVGKAAGNPAIFEQARQKAELRARLEAVREQERVSKLPQRPALAEPGSIEIPRLLHSWLTAKTNTDGRFGIAELGTLAAVLLAFANEDGSAIAGGRFEKIDGEPAIVIAGGVGAELRFARALGGSPISEPEDAGFVRLRPALRTLVRNKLLSVSVDPGTTRIRLGERARKLLPPA